MATSFANDGALEPEPTVAQDYQDFKSLDVTDEGRKGFGKVLPPRQSAWQRICPTSRLLFAVTGLCAVLGLLVIMLGVKVQGPACLGSPQPWGTQTSQGAQLGTDQEGAWESLRSFNKTVSAGLASLQQKRNSTGSRLATLEQTLNRETEEAERVKNRLENLLAILHQDSNSLQCEVVELKSNGSKSGCCPKGWVIYHESCYWLSRSQRPWLSAKQDCESRDSHLVIINSPEEKKIVEQLGAASYVWIGLTDSSGTWKWVDGTGYTVRAEDWGEGQPDHWYGHSLGGGEDCVHTQLDGLWNDNHCSRSFTWMCEQELKV